MLLLYIEKMKAFASNIKCLCSNLRFTDYEASSSFSAF